MGSILLDLFNLFIEQLFAIDQLLSIDQVIDQEWLIPAFNEVSMPGNLLTDRD